MKCNVINFKCSKIFIGQLDLSQITRGEWTVDESVLVQGSTVRERQIRSVVAVPAPPWGVSARQGPGYWPTQVYSQVLNHQTL